MVKCVAIGGITCAKAIPPNETQPPPNVVRQHRPCKEKAETLAADVGQSNQAADER